MNTYVKFCEEGKFYPITVIILVIILMAALLPTSSVYASGKAKNVVVTGTGDPTIDVPAIQAAVDQGGRVLLKGTFDFGDEGSVSVMNDVEIYGDSATIRNGKQTFAVGFDTSLPDGGDARHQEGYVGPNVVFKNLNFENALYSTIHVLATSGLRVEECTFTDGKYFQFFGPLGSHLSVFISGGWAVWSPYTGESADITGDILLKNNEWNGKSRVDLENGFLPWFGNPAPMNGITYPVAILSGRDVHITIKNNVSRNSGFYHFAVVNIQGKDSVIQIINNFVENDSDNVARVSVLCMCDMHMWTADMYPGLSELEPGDPEVSLVVKDNDVRFRGETYKYTTGLVIGSVNNAIVKNNKIEVATVGYGGGGSAIGLQGVNDSVVKDNEITLNGTASGDFPESGSYGIIIWATDIGSNGNEISGNLIQGSVNYGIIVGDSDVEYPPSMNNVIKENDLSNLTLLENAGELGGRIYSEAYVLFDLQSEGNVYFGHDGDSVLDFGIDNEFHINPVH